MHFYLRPTHGSSTQIYSMIKVVRNKRSSLRSRDALEINSQLGINSGEVTFSTSPRWNIRVLVKSYVPKRDERLSWLLSIKSSARLNWRAHVWRASALESSYDLERIDSLSDPSLIHSSRLTMRDVYLLLSIHSKKLRKWCARKTLLTRPNRVNILGLFYSTSNMNIFEFNNFLEIY